METHGMRNESPAPRDILGRELQKWIQCCKCEKWRKVPYSIDEEQIPDSWTCEDNIWDGAYNACEVGQELSDEKIDEILALQGEQELVYPQAQITSNQLQYDTLYDYDLDDGNRRGSRKPSRGRGGRGRGAGGKRNSKREDSGRTRGLKGQSNYSQEAAEALLGIVGTDGDQGEGRRMTTKRYSPGQLVWAKVEGHDWWPGKVVRRRAVPREVGPPPGVQNAARYQIPVVFFTPKGIPGENTNSPIKHDATIDASKPLLSEYISGDEEAEYAWLAVNALKPFTLGDKSGSPDIPPADDLLVECIKAANRAAELIKEDPDRENYDSDSDGGWGPQSSQINISLRGRRGNRGGRGRKGRSSRRGRGRGRWAKYEDDELSDDDYEPAYGAVQPDFGHSAPKIVVECILGWRRITRQSADGREGKRSEEDIEMESAVDALLAAADDNEKGLEFLVKYIGRSHIHNEWVAESTLMQIAKRKVLNFKKRYKCDLAGSTPLDLTAESWSIPERFISRRPAPHGPGWEILVKWQNLGIENATWESETERFMSSPACVALTRNLWERQSMALRRSSTEAWAEVEAKRIQFQKSPVDIVESPAYLSQTLMQHQIDGINWLRRNWAQRKHCILSDDQGLGKTATVLGFLNSLRCEFSCRGPILIIAPSSSLGFWEGEISQWLRELNSVTYSGSAIARSTLLESEIWLNPSAMDGRSIQAPIIHSRVPKADIVLTSHEAFASDAHELSMIEWEVVILDERHRIQSASLKAHHSLGALKANHRVLLSWPYFTNNIQELASQLTFIRPEYESLEDIPGVATNEQDSAAQISAIQSQLQPSTLQRSRSVIGKVAAPTHEIQLSFRLREGQLEAYKMALTKSYELLVDPKASRFSGYRAIQLQSVVSDLRNVCAHPELANLENNPSHILVRNAEDLLQCMAQSEKLQAFDQLLQAEKSIGRRIAVFAHSSPVLQLLSQCLDARFGQGTSVVIRAGTPPLECLKAVKSFNTDGSQVFCILMHPSACGLGLNLDQLDTVIFFDSDWSVTSDIVALCRARKLGNAENLRIYRLFCIETIEENLINLAEKTKGMEVALRQSHGRAYSQGSKVLDEILRLGIDQIFNNGSMKNPHRKDMVKQEHEIQVREIHNDFFQGDNIEILTTANPSSIYEKYLRNTKIGRCRIDSNLSGASIVDLSPWKPDMHSHQFHYIEGGEEDLSGGDGNDPDSHSRAEAALVAANFWAEILSAAWEKYQKEKGLSNPASVDEEVEDDEEDQNGMKRLCEEDENYKRPGRGRGRGRGRISKKRGEEEDDDPWYIKKRRKHGEGQHPDLTSEAVEYIGEWSRQTSVMNAIADPSTAEALIARNAFDRLDLMGAELGLPREIIDLSHQCAQILLVMRPIGEAPSDFQDYTLVAVIAVATYLGQHPMGEQHGLPTLAKRYGQDVTSLEQVFEYIIASVNNYRETYMRMQALQEEGILDDEDIDQISKDYSHPTGGLMAAMSDLDGFAAKLSAILQADLKPAALAAGALQTPDIDLTSAGSMNAKQLQDLSENLRNTYEQVGLLDRVQNIRVKNIQDEYQRFMERVRAKAQSAIDHANTAYSQQRNVLMARYEALSAELKRDYPNLAKTVPSPQAIGLNVHPKNSNNSAGSDRLGGPVEENPMNMLSHSMASQLLTLQSHWAANMAAQAGTGESGKQVEISDGVNRDQYANVIRNSVDKNRQTALHSQEQTMPMPTLQQVQNSNSAPFFAPSNDSGDRDYDIIDKDQLNEKSIIEMMEEDFEPEANPSHSDTKPEKVPNDRRGDSLFLPKEDGGLNIDPNLQSAQNAASVGSLSGWVHPGVARHPPEADNN